MSVITVVPLISSVKSSALIINFKGFPNASIKACILEVNPPLDPPKPYSSLP
ncbi:MAG: hypothetical protein P857_658 [Candidatus Xenolissoclinum pacificiensis L6]|uniref:Uncharacterized protein n=1 Tax=Candidatus Xenolissoclinum pacificiensis L6 TaxID=1401685 RepID=W2UZ78_9RICK|nr:MAG: hypothetical protein P857_658 [Candidatus Xenolissoclinum pacificiensis L6]